MVSSATIRALAKAESALAVRGDGTRRGYLEQHKRRYVDLLPKVSMGGAWLIDALLQRPSITFREAAELLGVTPAVANANVRKLQAAGVLTEITGQARNMVFAAQGIFELVHDSGEDVTVRLK